MKLRYSFLLASLTSLVFIYLSSCGKDQVTSDVKTAESIAMSQTIDFQQENLLEALANSWDNEILPFGVARKFIDSTAGYQKFVIDFGQMQLCGDYISRSGKFSVEQFTTNGKWDSLTCEILSNDSFGIQTIYGTIYLQGKFILKRRDILQVEADSKLLLYVKNSWEFNYTSNSMVFRLKKIPTSLSLNDGNMIYGNCLLEKANSNFSASADILGVSRPVDAPNFPIRGELNCKLATGEIVQVYFDPYTNLKYDKVAKGKFGDNEWFFDIQ